jgi:acyl carrier protein
MTREEIQKAVGQALASVAPEIDPAALRPDQPLRDQVDLDSMDFLRFLVELHRQLGVEVPEADYPQLSTLGSIVEYLAARVTR